MKILIKLWQHTHYSFFRLNVWINNVHLLIFKPIYKNKYNKKLDIYLGVNDSFEKFKTDISDREGLGIMIPNFLMSTIICSIGFILYNISIGLLGDDFVSRYYYFIMTIIFILVLYPTYRISVKNDAYLRYFNEFDEMPRKELIKWRIISIVTLLCLYAISFFSLYLHG